MLELLQQLWPLKRSLVSDGYDEAINIISKKYPVEVESFPSGMECWDWIIPDKWTCHDAYLETVDGKRLIDYHEHPLHCVEYSESVDRIVKKNELLSHLHSHPVNPKAIPYVFAFYEKKWGLCCAQEFKESLNEAEYRVVIDTKFEKGNLKVGKWLVKGQSDEIFVLCAHLCHPYSANDDLSGVVVGLELMDRLAKIPDLYYNYLLLLVPETIGSVAWLSGNEKLIPKIRGGLFLEMLGNDNPHALQRSYCNHSQLDLCCEHIIKKVDNNSYSRNFWRIIRNDEIEFNSPGIRIPMPSISRSLPPEAEYYPYPEYHTHLDTPDIIRKNRLEESADLIFRVLTSYDSNYYPKANFKGQVFLSRYNLFPKNPDDYETLFQTMFEMDGEHSVIDITLKHDLDFDKVLDVVKNFLKYNLISIKRKK